MGESASNMTAVLVENKPRLHPSMVLQGTLMCEAIIQPDVAITMLCSDFVAGVDGAPDKIRVAADAAWVELTKATLVWVVERDGAPPAKLWTWGVFVGMSLVDGGKQAISNSGKLIGFFDPETVRQMERELMFAPAGLPRTMERRQ